MTEAELKARPGSGADKGISKSSGSGIKAARESYKADSSRKELEMRGEKAWNDYVIRYHSQGLRDFDKRLRKDKGEDLSQVKEVFLNAFSKTEDPVRAWDDTSKFMYNYFNDISSKYRNGSGASTEYLQSIGQERGLASAYNEWARTTQKPEDKVRGENISSKDAEAMSRPGSGASKTIGSDTGKEIKEAQAEAFMKEQEKYSAADKGGGITLSPDKNLSSYADAVTEAGKIFNITGVPVSAKNGGKVKAECERLSKSGKESDAMQCKQCAVNIDYIYSKNKGTTDGDKIYPLFMYVRNVLDFNLFGNKQTFGKDKEKALIEAYKKLSSDFNSIGSKDIKTQLDFMKSIDSAFGNELNWYKSIPETYKEARERSIRRGGSDGKTGYSGLWVKSGDSVINYLMGDPVGFSKAYMSVMPWDGSAIMIDDGTTTKTWSDFAREVSDMAKSIEDANKQSSIDGSLLEEAREQTYDSLNKASKGQGLDVEPVADTGEQKPEEKKGVFKGWFDKATGLFKK